VIVEGVAAEGEEDQVSSTSVGGGLGLEHNRDEKADVLHAPGLVVELGHEGISRIVPEDRGGGGAVARRAGGGSADVVVGVRGEEVLRFGDLASQSISCIPLALPGQGSRADTGLSRCGRCSGGDKRGGEGGVGGVGVEPGRRWWGREDTLCQTPTSGHGGSGDGGGLRHGRRCGWAASAQEGSQGGVEIFGAHGLGFRAQEASKSCLERCRSGSWSRTGRSRAARRRQGGAPSRQGGIVGSDSRPT
jgi:hypothetical protein